MSVKKSDALDALIRRLSDEQKLAKKHSLKRTTYLLGIAVLDLKMLRYRITDKELSCLSDMLARPRKAGRG